MPHLNSVPNSPAPRSSSDTHSKKNALQHKIFNKSDASDHSWVTTITATSSRSGGRSEARERVNWRRAHEEWSFLIPDNSGATRAFADRGAMEAVDARQFAALACSVFGVCAAILLLLSDIGIVDTGSSRVLQIYEGLCHAGASIKMQVSGLALLAQITLQLSSKAIHKFVRLAVAMNIGMFYLLVFTAFFWVDTYPHLPFIMLNIHVPMALGLCRYFFARKSLASAFYKACSQVCWLVAVAIICVWLAWGVMVIGAHGSSVSACKSGSWGDCVSYQVRTSEESIGLRSVLGAPSRSACDASRALQSGDLGKVTVDEESACKRAAFISFLAGFSPALQAVWVALVGIFCRLQSCLLLADVGDSQFDRFLLGQLASVGGSALVCWCGGHMLGDHLGMSNVVVHGLWLAVITMLVWAYFAFEWQIGINIISERRYITPLRHLLATDWFKAWAFCMFSPLFASYFAVQFLCKKVQRATGDREGDRSWPRHALKVKRGFEAWHWGSILEKAFLWCIFFLTASILAAQVSVVFLSWLNGVLEEKMSFLSVAAIFYVVGISMFLCPVIPGVPVYISAGIIVVNRAVHEPNLGFWPGVGVAIAECMVLKLNAVTMQQKIFGELFGSFLWVQKAVGVHRIEARAMEAILEEPGMPLDKIIILCGGPDWPTSVMTGILRLKLSQMLLGTLPVVFLITPCVFAGAFLLDQKWADVSSLMIAGMGVTQGCAMLSALYVILLVVEAREEELKHFRPEHEKVMKYAQKQRVVDDIYNLCIEWPNQSFLMKCAIGSCIAVELLVCWGSFGMSSKCFAPFSINSDFGAPLSQGGLDGRPLNLLLPGGYALIFLMLVGCGLRCVYGTLVRMSMRRVEWSTKLLSAINKCGLSASISPRANRSLASSGHPSGRSSPGSQASTIPNEGTTQGPLPPAIGRAYTFGGSGSDSDGGGMPLAQKPPLQSRYATVKPGAAVWNGAVQPRIAQGKAEGPYDAEDTDGPCDAPVTHPWTGPLTPVGTPRSGARIDCGPATPRSLPAWCCSNGDRLDAGSFAEVKLSEL